mmetsp:Transcript_33964/g.84645  ORF Transcript_33964/g.84645 Transcript_33964/m.84645 type:complete len:359 (-) Transcript_33964:147-1223(-)
MILPTQPGLFASPSPHSSEGGTLSATTGSTHPHAAHLAQSYDARRPAHSLSFPSSPTCPSCAPSAASAVAPPVHTSASAPSPPSTPTATRGHSAPAATSSAFAGLPSEKPDFAPDAADACAVTCKPAASPPCSPSKRGSKPTFRVEREVHIAKAEGAKLGLTLSYFRGRVVVHSVAPSSPAYGLVEVGSWLTAVNGAEVTSFWRFNAAEYASRLIAKSASLTLSLLCFDTIGIRVQKFDPAAELKLEFDRSLGVVRVRSIGDVAMSCTSGCSMDIECGLRNLCEGDCIVSVDGQAVSSARDVLNGLASGSAEIRVLNLDACAAEHAFTSSTRASSWCDVFCPTQKDIPARCGFEDERV